HEIDNLKCTEFTLICCVNDVEEDLAVLWKMVAGTGQAIAPHNSSINAGPQVKSGSKKVPGHPEPRPKLEKPSAKSNIGGQLDSAWLPQPVYWNGAYRDFSPVHTDSDLGPHALFQRELSHRAYDNGSQSRHRGAVSGDSVDPRVYDKDGKKESEDSDANDSGYCLIFKDEYEN
ncbi:uncharacterized protein J7T54_000548, partial [Emericellopsis cladophorae]